MNLAVSAASPNGVLPALSLAGPELAIVLPTFNERENVPVVVDAIRNHLGGDIEWEIIFVDDDSPDKTARAVRELARFDYRIRCIQRIGRRGLSSAVVEGMLATSAMYIVVMDADLQHDQTLIRPMLQELRSGRHDVVIGSRYIAGGSTGDWEEGRVQGSKLATRAAHFVMRAPVQDVMSGFFGITRLAFEAALPRLSSIGFKILFDLFASSQTPLRFKELPYTFRPRQHGESKLDVSVIWDYGLLLLDKQIGAYIPARFISFSIVGALGVAVHFATFAIFFRGLDAPFVDAQLGGTIAAVTSNFLLNNALTFRDRRLHGMSMLKGWLVFSAVCSIGAIGNVGVASWLYGNNGSWLLASLAGVVVGSVWNYIMTAAYTWRK